MDTQSALALTDFLEKTSPSTDAMSPIYTENESVDDRFPRETQSNLKLRLPEPTDPPVADFEQLDVRSLKLERITWWIFSGVVGLAMSIGWLISGLVFRDRFDMAQWIGLAAVLGILLGFLWLAWIIPERNFASTFWKHKLDGLEIRRGIWWRHRIFIPSSRVQHTDVKQGPIERRFELATLIVNTGGTHEPSISLSGLSLAKAEWLRDQLSIDEGRFIDEPASQRKDVP